MLPLEDIELSSNVFFVKRFTYLSCLVQSQQTCCCCCYLLYIFGFCLTSLMSLIFRNYSSLCWVSKEEPLVIVGGGTYLTGWISFQSPNQQCWSTEGVFMANLTSLNSDKKISYVTSIAATFSYWRLASVACYYQVSVFNQSRQLWRTRATECLCWQSAEGCLFQDFWCAQDICWCRIHIFRGNLFL